MESLISLVQGSVSYLVPMIILLGLLIFVHELGHFLVAKFYKVRVEVFSLGFGPKLFKFKRGDTVYAISAIPLGGYVKMFGDDPTAEVNSEQRSYSFIHKPVGQRIAVVLAGPLMNFFFAIVVFAGVALLGEQVLAPEVGDVDVKSAAYQAGFRSGDKVVSVATEPVGSWDEMLKRIESNASKTIPVEVERAHGERETFQVTPKLAKNKNVLSWDREVGEIEGLTFTSHAAAIGILDPRSKASSAGLQTGDVVESINGVEVTKWRQLVAEVNRRVGAKETLEFKVQRGLFEADRKSKPETLTLSVPYSDDLQSVRAEQMMAALGIEFPELYLASVEPDSPASAAGLKKGDRLISIDGQDVMSFEEVATLIRSYGMSPGSQSTAPSDQDELRPLNILVSRDGEQLSLAVAPNLKERMNQQGQEERRFEIGIRPMAVTAPPSTFTITSSNPAHAVVRGFQQTVKWTNLTVLSFVRLFQNEVSAKNIGGFLSIGQMAKRSWQIGLNQFLTVMGIISINLFILNLLPIPILDGGHLVFYSIEALRGAPLSMRKMEIAQQVGMVLLLGLMVFALFNDISRIFNPW